MKDIKTIKAEILDKLKLTRYWVNQRKYNLGKHTYLSHNTQIADRKNTYIGSYCSIANNVVIGIGNHPYDILTTHPMTYMNDGLKLYGKIEIDKENLIKQENKITKIGNDVWIGHGAIILAGVKICDGAIIGAGAIVTKDVEPYSIVAGVPAKVIKYRFNKEIIGKLLELKWWELPEYQLTKLTFNDIQTTIKELENLKNK